MSPSSILVLGIGLVLLMPLVARAARRRFDLFEPLVVFAVAYGVVFVARPAWMLAHGELSYFGIDIRTTLPRTLLLALAGAVAFVGGYELLGGRALARRLPVPPELSARGGAVGALALIGLAATALLITVWPAGGLDRLTVLLGGQTEEAQRLIVARGGYAFNTAMLGVPAGLILLALAIRHRTRGLVLGAGLTFAFALVVLVPIGARTFLLPLLGGALVLAYVTRGVRPRARMVAALVVAALLGSYALTIVRTPEQRADFGSELRRLAERPDLPFRFAFTGADAEMVPVFAAALHVVPSRLEYGYGRAVLRDLVTRPVPRQLWPGKPERVVEQLVGAIWPDLVGRFNPGFSSVLFYYWDFGLPGVAAGMALFGIACRTLYEWFLRHRESVTAQLVFAVGLWLVVPAVRTTPVDAVVLAGFLVLPIVVIAWVSTVRRAGVAGVRADPR